MAYRYQLSTVAPDGTKREMRQWFAPELGCWEIQQVTSKYNSQGILDGLFEKKVTEITPGEPDVALFVIPEDYREVSNSEREKAVILQHVADREGLKAASTHEIPSSITSRWKQADEHYNAVAKKQWHPELSSTR